MESIQKIAGILKSAKLSVELETLKALEQDKIALRLYITLTFISQLSQILFLSLISYKIVSLFDFIG